jgi:hypothetical protein
MIGWRNKIDEHGQAVHEECYLVALPFHHTTILRSEILCDNVSILRGLSQSSAAPTAGLGTSSAH